MYRPDEIVVNKDVLDDPITQHILECCASVPVRIVKTNLSNDIIAASELLSSASSMADRIAAGKRVLALVTTVGDIDLFEMPDPRMGCPHFMKLVTASNGCPFRCSWCFLRGTYRARQPYMAVHVRYDKLLERILCILRRSSETVLFNMGELQDGLALEHLICAAQTLIPFFGDLPNGRLFLLTKSDNVDAILRLRHGGHTTVAWSLNAPEVSREFEIGAPSFEQRIRAAQRVQEAGYPLRLRLDPIVPLPGWRELYASTIQEIFRRFTPERITLGTLRFEEEWYRNRCKHLNPQSPGCRLLDEMAQMEPMLPPMEVPTGQKDKQGRPKTKVSVGKHSYPESLRVEIFRFAIDEIRRHFDGPIALCKETVPVWQAVGLDPHRCQCVCQYGRADIVRQTTGDRR